MWKKIFDKLKVEGLNPHAPGQHKGLCASPYCVIKEGSQIQSIYSNRLGQKAMDIIIFAPLDSYIALDVYAKEIRIALRDVEGLRKTGFETPVIIDDDKDAYTISIQYVVIKKLEV